MPAQILIIEDEPDLRENLQQLLAFEGYRVLSAADGAEGLRLAREHHPDLILCDVIMPRMDGYDVLAALRSDPALCTTPLIFLTARSGRDDWRRGMALGASDYIVKPSSFRKILNAVQTRLARHEMIQAEFEQQIEHLRRSLVFALPLELRAPLEQILQRADWLQNNAGTLTARELHHVARTLFDAAQMLQRQIENYLLFSLVGILRFSPERVIVRREEMITGPADVIAQAARRAAAAQQREADLLLRVSDAAVRVATGSLYKIVEELVSVGLTSTLPGKRMRIDASASELAYILTITTSGIVLAADILSALQPAEHPTQVWRVLRAPVLGIIVVQYLVRVHGGRLAWRYFPEREMQWIVTFDLAGNDAAHNRE